MNTQIDVNWFNENLSASLAGYDVQQRFFEQGDFGSLLQVEFNSPRLGGNVDFWGEGKIGIFVWDFQNEVQLMNILMEPAEFEVQVKAFRELAGILKQAD